MRIPVGFRFEPTEEELIRGFLLPQVMGVAPSWNGIIERKVYGDDAAPWEVFSDAGEPSIYWNRKKEGGVTKDSTYVFTTLGRIPNKKNIPRTAGGGTWKGQTTGKKIKNSNTGAIIGNSKMYTFESPKFDVTVSSELGHWIMHEYALAGAALEETGLTGACDLVICKITRCMMINPSMQVQPHLPLNNKRAAEECPPQETSCKKQRCDGDGDGDSFFDAAATGGAEDYLEYYAAPIKAVGGEGFLDAPATQAEVVGCEGFFDAAATGGEGSLEYYAAPIEAVGGEGFSDAPATQAEVVGSEGYFDAAAATGGEGSLEYYAAPIEAVVGEGFSDALATEAVGDFDFDFDFDFGDDCGSWLNNFSNDLGETEGTKLDDLDQWLFPDSGFSPTLEAF